MPRELTEQQNQNLTATATRPIYVVEHEHSGVPEFVSTTDRILFDGNLYEEGGIEVTSVRDSASATLSLFACPDRASEVQNGTWRGGAVRIYYIPALPGDDESFDAVDGSLVLDGEITTSRLSGGRVVFTATHTSLLNTLSPRTTWDELSPFCPPAGSAIAWEGDRYTLSTHSAGRDSEAGANPATAARGRLSASKIRDLSQQENRELALTRTGRGTPVSILYGERAVDGVILGVGGIGSDLVLVVGWCWGECGGVQKLFINGETPPAGVTATHYSGSITQTVDATAASAIPAWNVRMIHESGGNQQGAAYSVVRIPLGLLNAAPVISAIVRGRKVYDSRLVPAPAAPYSARHWGIRVLSTRTSDSFLANVSEFRVSAYGGGPDQVGSGTASATSFYPSRPASQAFDGSAATFWSSDDSEAAPQLLMYDFGAPVDCQRVVLRAGNDAARAERAPKDFDVIYSDDGVTWSTAQEFRNEAAWSVSELRSFIVPQKPATTQHEFSRNPALCASDLINNPVYGLGVGTVGVEESANWCDSLIDGAIIRSQLDIILSEPRRTADYIDLIAGVHGECVWFNEGRDVRLKPDKMVGADNPSGQLLNANSEFAADSDWTKGDGWTISGGVALCDGSQTALSLLTQSIDTEAGTEYAIAAKVTRSAGSYALHVDGEVGGVFTDGAKEWAVKVAGTGSPVTIGLRADADFVGTVEYVTLKRLYWLETNYIRGSLTVEGLDQANAPNAVSARYTQPSGTSPNWPETSTTPIVNPGTSELSATTLHLRGTTRLVEATSKANTRLHRYRNRVRYSWETTDHGYRFRRADVARLLLPFDGIDETVWIESAEMTSYGRHRITGYRYSEDQYPDEIVLPENTGLVPVGAIALLSGSTVPSGWADYTAANGHYIVGAGGSYAVGDTGGNDTFAGWSGQTSSNDMHESGSSSTSFVSPTGAITSGTGGARPSTPDTTHPHTYSTGSITPDPLTRQNRLVIKTGSASTKIPADVRTLGLPGIMAANASRIHTYAGRLLRAASSYANSGSSNKTVSFRVDSYNGSHSHIVSDPFISNSVDLGPQTYYYDYESSFIHDHAVTATLNVSVKRRGFALYGGTDDYDVLPGRIFLWAGSLASLPTDYVLCDGSNGTPDFREHYLEFAQSGEEGDAAGDNTISLTTNTAPFSHSHRGAMRGPIGRSFMLLNHSDTASHAHEISESAPWQPKYYALAAIMYQPS